MPLSRRMFSLGAVAVGLACSLRPMPTHAASGAEAPGQDFLGLLDEAWQGGSYAVRLLRHGSVAGTCMLHPGREWGPVQDRGVANVARLVQEAFSLCPCGRGFDSRVYRTERITRAEADLPEGMEGVRLGYMPIQDGGMFLDARILTKSA